MENFFNYFKQKLSLEDDHLYLLRNIVLNDNIIFVKENFNIFIENKLHYMNDSNYFYCSLFLYCLDIHREFKKKLLNIISSKLLSYKDVNAYISNFLTYIDLSLLSSNNTNELKFKILLLNNLYDISMKYFNSNNKQKTKNEKDNNKDNKKENKKDKNKKEEKKEDKNEDKDKEKIKYELLNKFFGYYINSFEKKEFSFLLKNSNDEIGMILTFYINCLLNIINNIYSNDIQYNFSNILSIIENDLINIPIDYSIKTKDLLFIYSNLYFNLFLKMNKSDESVLKSSADDFFQKCLNNSKSFEIIFSYIKGLFNNFTYNNSINCYTKEKINIFNKFIDNKIILGKDEAELRHDLSLAEFYLYFLEHDINGKYSLIINDIIVLILVKIISTKNDKIKNDLIKWITDSKIVDLITKKIEKEKNNFNFIEDNFFDILSFIYNKTNPELKKYISAKINEYLINIINSKKRPLTNECTLFIFLKDEIKNNVNNNKNTLIDFMKLIMSFPYDKKDISLIMENSRTFFDYYKEEKDFVEFYQTFPEYFVKYLNKIPIQYLQNLNTLYLQLSKANPCLYYLIVKYCYNYIKQFKNEKKQITKEEYISIYGVFFSLLRPVRLQKKSLFMKDNEIHISNAKLKEEVVIDINFISYLVLSTNEYLTLDIIEFLNELEDKNTIFKIIMKIIKYSIKNQNQEFKGGLFKSLRLYFSQYFIQITKLINKYDKNTNKENDDKKYLDIALNTNMIKLCNYLSNAIYDRPVENLLTYLELLKLIINLIDDNLYKIIKDNNDLYKNNDVFKNFISNYEKTIFEKGLCLSLISLLKHSWSYVRANSYDILSNKKYTPFFLQMKKDLIKEIKKYSFSLRQMDEEGSACLFVLLLLHNDSDNNINDEIINEIFLEIFECDLKKVDLKNFYCQNKINRILEIILYLIKERKNEYVNLIKNNSKIFDIKKYSIHPFFIFIRNIIDLQKNKFNLKNKNIFEILRLLFELSSYIISLNTDFLQFLINNGVSEFTLDEGNEQIEEDNENSTNANHENKLMISLWNSSKFSLGTLNSILDIFSSNYQNISSYLSQNKNVDNNDNDKDFKSIFLNPLKKNFEDIIPIIVNAKHMGVVRSMSDCLYKISVILNKSEYNLICKDKINNFVEKELPNHVVSSILRRSAGIPFLMTTLIRSYITENYSYNFIKTILKNTSDNLLSNFNKYQDTQMDAAVHCLHILRVICDDTIIKPFIKEFYDVIIMNIIKGLQSKNWSIKNACMLMFSRIITNNFLLQNEVEMQRTLLTFKEYFYDKNNFYNVIIDILSKNNKDSKLNDCLLLFVTFFTKMRYSKPNEYQNERLLKVIDLLFEMDKKDNKLFRKLLSSALFKLYGGNYAKMIKDIKERMNNIISNNQNKNVKDDNVFLELNNQLDFYYNIVNELIKLKDEQIEPTTKLDLVLLYKKLFLLLFSNNINTYFGLSKYVQLIKKISKIDEMMNGKSADDNNLLKDINYDFKTLLGIDNVKKSIDLNILFPTLEKNSRVFNFFKFIKHIFALYINKLNYSLEKIDLVKHFKNKKLEEIIVLLFKRYSNKITYDFVSSLFQSNEIENLNDYSVNISSQLILFFEKCIRKISINLSHENNKILLNKIIFILKDSKGKTKLVTKLFSLLPLLLIYNNTNNENYKKEYLNELNSVLEIIYDYIQSDNLDKLRIAGLLCLDKIVKDIININKKYTINIFKEDEELKLLALKIIFLLLNDEYANIRKKASEIFILFNTLTEILSINDSHLCLINDYLCQKMLSKININNGINRKFCEYVMNNNFYFRTNIFETKVFYSEPDNNYIDNSQNKMLIIKNILKNNFDSKNFNTTIDNQTMKENTGDQIMIIFEEFTDKIKNVCQNIIREKQEGEDNKFNCTKYIYKNLIRPEIYLLNK